MVGAQFLIEAQPAILEVDDPAAVPGQFGIMGDHDNGFALLVEGSQKVHDHLTGAGVQIAGWFIGDYYAGIVYEGPGHSHPLDLAAT